MEIDWQNVTVTLNGSVVNLPGSVIIPFRDKFKIRQMLCRAVCGKELRILFI